MHRHAHAQERVRRSTLPASHADEHILVLHRDALRAWSQESQAACVGEASPEASTTEWEGARVSWFQRVCPFESDVAELISHPVNPCCVGPDTGPGPHSFRHPHTVSDSTRSHA